MGQRIKLCKLVFYNGLWALSCFPAWFCFYAGLPLLSYIQRRKLLNIVRRNQSSEFGRKYNFAAVRSIADFQQNVPVLDYDDLESFVQKILDGEQGILTEDKVFLLEPTSGSTGAVKYIPYTQALRKEFQRGFYPWLFDVYIHNLRLLCGKSFWSITPKQDIKKGSRIKIGFEHDTHYLGKVAQYVAPHVMVSVPDAVTTEQYLQQAYITLKNEPDLALIFIWSPTFLDCLFKDLDCLPDKQWKKMCLISAWGDANSRTYASIISKYFPRAKFQPKGLLSTECLISFPLERLNNRSVLSYQSHFFEFMDKEGRIYLVGQLKEGGTYTVIVTTSGGLYRYNTHDDVLVSGFYHGLPVLEFIGRSNCTGDFFGEKLSERFVLKACHKVFDQQGIVPVFFLVVFDKVRYVLLVEGANIDCASLGYDLNQELEENFHYMNCVQLGQLQPLRCQLITGGREQYTKFYLKKGMKLGDIKIKALDTIFWKDQ